MSRKWPHLLSLAVLLATASGAALGAHEAVAGSHHDSHHCPICQDLLVGVKAVMPVAPSVATSAAVVAVVVAIDAQQPAIPTLPPAVAPRGPPIA